MVELKAELLSEFLELIYGRSSLRFVPSRLTNVELQLHERVSARNMQSFEEYLKLLQNSPEEFNHLLERITTKETHFFRLPGQFEALNELVIPELEEKMVRESQLQLSRENGLDSGRIPFRIWSAGCSTGEEPYTIAMALTETLKYRRAWQVEILATDICREVIQKATAGIYGQRSLKQLPETYRNKYLRQTSDGMFFVNSCLADLISFLVFNLGSLSPGEKKIGQLSRMSGEKETLNFHERFEIIFCRNVMIYFDFPAQQRLVSNLYECLKPGGYLFTGDAELLNIYCHDFNTVEWKGTYFYRKPKKK